MTNISTTDLITSINDAGGLSIRMVAETEGNQFLITILISLLGSAVLFILLWDKFFAPMASEVLFKLKMRKYKGKTNRNILLIKHTETHLFGSSMIDTDTVMKFEKAIRKFAGKPFDLVLHTPGGGMFPAQILVRAIQSYPSEIRAVIPLYAMSGGTLLTLAANRILMGPYACLGPVDPQLSSLFSFGSANAWQEVLRIKGDKAKDESIRMAHMGEQVTASIRETLNGIIQQHIPDPELRKDAVEFLTDGHMQHGQPLPADIMIALGFSVEPIDPEYHTILMGLISSNLQDGVYKL